MITREIRIKCDAFGCNTTSITKIPDYINLPANDDTELFNAAQNAGWRIINSKCACCVDCYNRIQNDPKK